MAKSAVYGLISGLAVVVLTLIVVAVVNLPQAAAVSAPRNPSVHCSLADVTQDQGYGLSRTVKRQVCSAASVD